jgi:hypothetical protein
VEREVVPVDVVVIKVWRRWRGHWPPTAACPLSFRQQPPLSRPHFVKPNRYFLFFCAAPARGQLRLDFHRHEHPTAHLGTERRAQQPQLRADSTVVGFPIPWKTRSRGLVSHSEFTGKPELLAYNLNRRDRCCGYHSVLKTGSLLKCDPVPGACSEPVTYVYSKSDGYNHRLQKL